MMRTTAAFRDIAVVVGVLALGMACGPQPGEGAVDGDPQDSPEVAARKGGGSGGGKDPVVVPPSPSVVLAFAAAAPAGAFEPIVSATIMDTATLYVVADWKNAPSGAAERLDVLMPGGALYASLELPIGETDRGDVQFQVLEDGTRRVTYLLQVWGTPIESYQMTGPWSARVTLVGGTATATAGVTLE